MSLVDKIQELIESEVQKRISQYAQVISKRHDISLKLLLEDAKNVTTVNTGQCMGLTAKKQQCRMSGPHDGYCMRHHNQRKLTPVATPNTVNKHVGHTLTECIFLSGCPACEKTKSMSRPNLLIEL
jgi:Family of unknown function (DUF5763)